LSTIQHADRIYVMDQGKVVQSGSFTQLMEEDGLFRELAARQEA
jgi:ABC-type multidrug transport system fused ATPase/permease subunit